MPIVMQQLCSQEEVNLKYRLHSMVVYVLQYMQFCTYVSDRLV